MSENNAAVPKKGGSGVLIIGLLLLIGAGGLVFFKMNTDEEPTVEEVRTIKNAPEAPPQLAEAPPPPPPVEEPEPEPEVAVAQPGTAPPKGPSGCSAPCNGEMSPAIEATLRARAGQARTCYNRALRVNSMLEGKMSVAVRISSGGGVCSASVQSDTLGDPATAACVAEKFRAGGYPAPTGGCVDTAVPLNFVKK